MKMVKEINNNYQCEECKLIYKDKSVAKKCEKWCKENKSCNLEITKYALNKTNK